MCVSLQDTIDIKCSMTSGSDFLDETFRLGQPNGLRMLRLSLLAQLGFGLPGKWQGSPKNTTYTNTLSWVWGYDPFEHKYT